LYTIILLLIGALCLFNILSVFGGVSDQIARWPIALISIFILIIHSIVPLTKDYQQFYRLQFDYDNDAKLQAAVFILVLIMSITILNRLFFSKKIHFSRNQETLIPSKFLFMIFALYAVGLLLALRDISIINATGGFEAYNNDRIGSSEDRGAARILGFVMVTASCLFVRYFAIFTRWRNAFILLAMLIYPTYYFTLLSSRNSILIMYLLMIFIFLTSKKVILRLTARTFFVLIGVGVVTSVAGAVIYQTTDARYSQNDSRYLQERRDNIVLYGLDGAFGNDENVIWLQQRDFDKAYGKTYLASLAVPIPRAWWPDKPLGGGPFLVNTIFPGRYSVGNTGQTSFTTGLAAEALLNFGFIGLLLISIAWVSVISLLVQKAISTTNEYAATACLISIFYISTTLVYSEFLGGFARMIVTVGPLMLAVMMGKLFLRPAQPSRNLHMRQT
jgi:oligosaccharide repeat unit polymerase